jgi:hypothetical protein
MYESNYEVIISYLDLYIAFRRDENSYIILSILGLEQMKWTKANGKRTSKKDLAKLAWESSILMIIRSYLEGKATFYSRVSLF